MARRQTSPGSSKTGRKRSKTTRNSATQTQTPPRRPPPSLVLPTARAISSSQRRSQQQARRRRQTARRVRNFESMVSRVQGTSAVIPDIGLSSLWRSTNWHPSRFLSLFLLLAAIGTIGWVHYDLQWYVYREHVTFHNLTYHDEDALYSIIDVDGWNIFWLTAGGIRKQLVALPTITDARVQISPPHSVIIVVEETEPIALWATREGDFWLLPDGTALPRIDERYDALPKIIDHLREASARSDPQRQRMEQDILTSALALLAQVPMIDNLYFNAGYGLNFHLPGSNTWVYWGDGKNATRKYENLVAIQQALRTEQRSVDVVDIRFGNPVIR